MDDCTLIYSVSSAKTAVWLKPEHVNCRPSGHQRARENGWWFQRQVELSLFLCCHNKNSQGEVLLYTHVHSCFSPGLWHLFRSSINLCVVTSSCADTFTPSKLKHRIMEPSCAPHLLVFEITTVHSRKVNCRTVPPLVAFLCFSFSLVFSYREQNTHFTSLTSFPVYTYYLAQWDLNSRLSICALPKYKCFQTCPRWVGKWITAPDQNTP